MIARQILTIVLVLVVAGCSTQARLAVHSQPAGAYISEKGSGTVYGVAPTVVVYDANALANHKRADGCYYVRGLEAKWVSGATASLESIKLCGEANGVYNITFSRSPDYPDLERDLQFALSLKSADAQQRQARAAQEAANAATYQATKPRKAVNCTSSQIGNTVQTNCY